MRYIEESGSMKENKEYSLARLLAGIKYELVRGEVTGNVTGVHYNTGSVTRGSVFVCIKGARNDSHELAQSAVYHGATVIVTEREVTVTSGVTVIRTDNTREALALMSAAYFGYPSNSMTMIAITGTKGKTTISYMIRDILMAAGIKTGVIGSIGVDYAGIRVPCENTTPESYEIHKILYKMRNSGIKAVVMEVSSQGIKYDRVKGIHFDYGIFTNISHDHIGGNEHKDMEEYVGYKSDLFAACDVSVLNIDDKYYNKMAEKSRGKIIYYGIKNEDKIPDCVTPYRIERVFTENGPGMKYCLSDYEYTLGLPGLFSVYNAVAAGIVCEDILADDEKDTISLLISEVYENIRIKGRCEYIKNPGYAGIVIDYAHNSGSLKELLQAIRLYTKGKLVCLFGCGGNRSVLRRYEMGEVSAKYADITVITSDNPRYEDAENIMKDIEKGLLKVLSENDRIENDYGDFVNGKYIMIEDRKRAIEISLSKTSEDDIIVVAGKGHESYQEIRGKRYHLDDREIAMNIENIK